MSGGEREGEKKAYNSHWDVYARDVAAITVRASGSTITLDLPT